MPIEAGYLEPTDNQVYIFKEDRPKPFETAWKALAETGFTKIDAILPIPAYSGQIWVFNGTQYAWFNFTEDTVVHSCLFGPAPLSKHWPVLVNANITSVDAVIPTPGCPSDEIFF
ncbi:Hemopexin [Penicillium sp. IBT 35674x]|nr:Hemopexin [Penicillium sp. IBT 35674x]